MKRILFFVRGIPIYSYPAMLYVGLVAGVISGNYAAHVAGLDSFRVYIATCLLLIPALAGSRLLHVAVHWERYRNDRAWIWDRTQGGMAQYGGILLAVPLSIPLLTAMQLPFGAFWDVGSFTILVGMIFTRIGCLLNGCCSGRPSDAWGTLYLKNGAGVLRKRIPVQLMEASWAAIILATAWLAWGMLPFDGALFILICAAYSIGRLALESMRENRPPGKTFTVHHAISLLIIGVSIAAVAGRAFM